MNRHGDNHHQAIPIFDKHFANLRRVIFAAQNTWWHVKIRPLDRKTKNDICRTQTQEENANGIWWVRDGMLAVWPDMCDTPLPKSDWKHAFYVEKKRMEVKSELWIWWATRTMWKYIFSTCEISIWNHIFCVRNSNNSFCRGFSFVLDKFNVVGACWRVG